MKARTARLTIVRKCGYLLVLLGFVSSCVLAAGQNAYSADKPASTASAGLGVSESDYVGADTCKSCHQDIYTSWEKTPHWKTTLNKRGGPSKQGCEACHGPGKAHVEGGGDVTKIFTFKNVSAKTISDRCLTCHAGGTEHMNAINSVHALNGVSCIDCHSPHHAETKEYLLVKAQPELCYSCHLQKKAEFAMPFHHRVNEGLVQCSDCHNPHGTERPKQVRTSATLDAVCFKCHVDKQGPFVFEHEPVKVEDVPPAIFLTEAPTRTC
jgi:DmsE family decaheme c-type cytochrome